MTAAGTAPSWRAACAATSMATGWSSRVAGRASSHRRRTGEGGGTGASATRRRISATNRSSPSARGYARARSPWSTHHRAAAARVVRRCSSSITRSESPVHSAWGTNSPPASRCTSGTGGNSATTWTTRPRSRPASSSPAPPVATMTPSSSRAAGGSDGTTSSASSWRARSVVRVAGSAAARVTSAGQPPVPRRPSSTPSSSSVNNRSAASIECTRRCARSRLSGTGGSRRDANQRLTPWGSEMTRSRSSAAPVEPGWISCTSSRTRQTGPPADGSRQVHSAAADAGRVAVRPARVTASANPSSRCRSSESAGSQASHTSVPLGARAFSAIACASRVVLPMPAAATSVVTR